MAVTFNQIPANLRVPLAYFEVNAGYTPSTSLARLLLIGQKTTGTAIANQPILVTGSEDGLFGVGSMLAIMYKSARLNAPFQEIWCLPLADAVGSTAATATITVAGAPVATAGTVAVYVGDTKVSVNVTTLMTNTQIAAAFVTAINTSFLPIEATASNIAAVVTLTANNKGTIYNGLKLQTRLAADDAILSDTLLTVTSFAGGAGDPDLSTALSMLGSDEYDYITSPYTDSTNTGEVDSLLFGRWSPIQALYGAYISYKDASAGALQTLGASHNSPNLTIYGATNFSSSVPKIAAALGAVHADHLQGAPELSRPLQGLLLQGIVGPKLVSDRLGIQAQNTLLFSGISTLAVSKTGDVTISRGITTYQTNAYGSADQSFLSVNTRAQLVYGLRYIKQYVTSVWGRAALVDANPTGIQNFATAADLQDSMVHAYRGLVALGVFENPDLFASLLIVERDAIDVNRVNAYLPLDAVNQLNVFAANATSYLELSNVA